MSVTLNRARHPKLKRTLRSIARNWDLYLLLVPVLAYFIIFHYAPMYGVQIAFRRYSIRKGILGSQWVGMAHFNRFFQSYYFERLLVNTLTISLYNLALGFPLPILLALLLNEVTSKRYKKLVQTITYAPHFLSAVVLVSIINAMFSTSTGIINNLIVLFGGEKVAFTTDPRIFKSLYVLSGVWQNMGWNSIIYMAALSGIDPTLYEAAELDGCTPNQMFWKITLPLIRPILVYVMITSMIGGLQMFDVPQILTNGKGGPDRTSTTMIMYLNNHLFSKNYGMAGAVSVVLFLVCAVLCVVVYFSLTKEDDGLTKAQRKELKAAKKAAAKGGK